MSRDWLDKNFYATLGVPQDASISEIKKAYKKLARENHPDLNPGDLEAEKRFKEVFKWLFLEIIKINLINIDVH